MTIARGTRLGQYEFVELIGSGGMGEVYRAHDTRLNRDVAIKVLPDEVASDPERVARFAREARMLAALNHPHIATIHDFETADGFSGLVLELVHGPTLADRLREGPLALAEAITVAEQIAAAVDAAHEKGIIHRDLKPANIKLTDAGHVKVLDFGLAKALDTALASDSAAPTVTALAATQAGAFIGTPAYMSPEQARGEPLDKRTDIWSFGVVLYEMLTGSRPFEGQTTTETLAAVLKDDPACDRVPVAARRLVIRCLEKDRRRRLRDIADAAALLDVAADPVLTRRRSPDARWRWPAIAGLLLIATIGALLLPRKLRHPEPQLPIRFEVAARPGEYVDAPVLSPDGRSIAFLSSETNSPARRLWLHSFDSGQSRQLFEAERSATGPPFWSPDGRSIALAADGKLEKIEIADGSGQTVTEVRLVFGAGSWSRDGVILFSTSTGLMRVAAAGGPAVSVTTVDPRAGEIGHFSPTFLDDARHFLYLRASSVMRGGIYVGSVDARPEDQSRTRLIDTPAGAVYSPGAGGEDARVLFLQENALMSQRFDSRKLQLKGEPVRVADQVGESNHYVLASVSPTGVLALRHAQPIQALPVWVDRNGNERGTIAGTPLAGLENVRISPDGSRLAMVVQRDIWVYDLAGKPPVKLTFDGRNDYPLWSPDGRRIVYSALSPPHLVSVSADGTGPAPQSVSPPGHYHPIGWSADGREMIVVLNTYSPTNWDILKLPAHGAGQPVPVVQTEYVEGMLGAGLSPDGRWLAYVSNVTGDPEVWVQPYPGPGAQIRVSPNHGTDPVWAKDGRGLYYLEGTKLMIVPVSAAHDVSFDIPTRLFDSPYLHRPGWPLSYDIAADGRFVMVKRAETQQPASPIVVVLNWTSAAPTR